MRTYISNFEKEYELGKSGRGRGLSMGPGLSHLSQELGGIQQGRIYVIASEPKVGKSTLCDNGFVIEPWLDAQVKNIPLKIIYLSLEIDLIDKMFDWIAHFMWRDGNGMMEVNGVPLCGNLLRGRVIDERGAIVPLTKEAEELMFQVYHTRVIPLLGEYDEHGKMVKEGSVLFSEYRGTAHDTFRHLCEWAKKYGVFNNDEHNGTLRYIPYDAKQRVIVVVDHLRKIRCANGQRQKDAMDSFMQQSVAMRNMCNWTFVEIVHTNRNVSELGRIKQFQEELYPHSDDIKDSGNLAEDADYVITMFNPNDGKYGLKRHFGIEIRGLNGQVLDPNLRTIHIVENRHGPCPQHLKVRMHGGVKAFERLRSTRT